MRKVLVTWRIRTAVVSATRAYRKARIVMTTLPPGRAVPRRFRHSSAQRAGLKRLYLGVGKNGIVRCIREEVIAHEQSRRVQLVP
jgi:hypothetical protein